MTRLLSFTILSATLAALLPSLARAACLASDCRMIELEIEGCSVAPPGADAPRVKPGVFLIGRVAREKTLLSGVCVRDDLQGGEPVAWKSGPGGTETILFVSTSSCDGLVTGARKTIVMRRPCCDTKPAISIDCALRQEIAGEEIPAHLAGQARD